MQNDADKTLISYVVLFYGVSVSYKIVVRMSEYRRKIKKKKNVDREIDSAILRESFLLNIQCA